MVITATCSGRSDYREQTIILFQGGEEMKRKKLLSTAVAGMLVMAQMVMPVMAADGGTIDVDVTTRTGILRVKVPTTLAIAVDQFETGATGTQIYSEEFGIENMSEVNVKVSVTSTATVKDGVTLAAKRADVATATAADGTAWMAVAAKKDATHYEATTGTDDFANLNEAAANVATFAKDGTTVKAAQTFYLKKSSATATYKMLKPAADGENNDVSYAQFYKLTAIGTQPTDNDTLGAAVAASDVYVIVTSNAGTDGTSVTKIAKGSTVDASNNTFAGANTYYTAANSATAKDDLKAADIYVYGEMTKEATGADAAFRYIGALSSNKELWDSTDISKISITYTIQGLPQSTYDAAVAEGITYGLYKEKVAAVYSEVSGAYWISLDGKEGFAAAPTSLTIDGTASTAYTFEKSGWIKLNAKPADGKDIEFVVNGVTYKATTPAAANP